MAAAQAASETSSLLGTVTLCRSCGRTSALVIAGASAERRTRHDDPEEPIYAVVMHDPEGNEFCVS